MNTPIEIVEAIEVIDNWGRTDRYVGEELAKVLKDPEAWSDDISFMDRNERLYFIDDLIGKEVKVGAEIFVVTEDEAVIEALQEAKNLIDPVLKLKETLKELIKKYPNDDELGKSIRRLELD
jgi:hypothetical protein